MLPVQIGETPFDRNAFELLTQVLGEGLEDHARFTSLLGYTPAAVAALLQVPEFLREVRRTRLAFLSPENAAERLRRKCDVLLEHELLPQLRVLALDAHVPPADRLRAIGLVKEMSTSQKERDELRSAGNGNISAGRDFILNITQPGGAPLRIGRVVHEQ